MKRTFVQLAHTYNPKKYILNDWFVSEKLDGMRAFWDGGISRGVLSKDVPWANTVKDDRLVEPMFATGLWSRTGKVIAAPDWWLDQLPNLPLDGELWSGYKTFQTLVSTTKSLNGYGWEPVRYFVFDSPSYETIFADGEIEVRQGNKKYNFVIRGAMKWIKEQSGGRFKYLNPNASFESVYNYLLDQVEENDVLEILTQCRIGNSEQLDEIYQDVLAKGGEGVILRHPKSCYQTGRTHSCLKYKPFDIDEGTVIGYTWGREGKLLGKMGALIVNFKGQQLKVSGFTDEERRMTSLVQSPYDPDDWAMIVGEQNSSLRVDDRFENPRFPRGSTIRFLYRELTDSGLPKEARYHNIEEVK